MQTIVSLESQFWDGRIWSLDTKLWEGKKWTKTHGAPSANGHTPSPSGCNHSQCLSHKLKWARALAVGWSNLPIICQIKHLVQNKVHTKLLDCLLIYTLIPALRKATKEGSAWDICQECIKKEDEEKCEGRWGGRGTWGRCKQAYFLSYTLHCGSDI